MAISNYEHVGKTMEVLRQGLQPFIERELQVQYGKYWITKATAGWRNELNWPENAASPIGMSLPCCASRGSSGTRSSARPWALLSAHW